MNKQLPILMISGKMILLESMAEVLNPWRKFTKAGIKHITVQLYANRRHEILFEVDQQMIWNHMFDWIQNKY